MQAIKTKWLSPTNNRGTRIAASCQAGRLIVDYEYELGIDDNHARAARMLADKLGWKWTEFIGGNIDAGIMAWVANCKASYETIPVNQYKVEP